jgi:hypothetical protein
MNKKLLPLVFIGIGLASVSWAQTENPALKKLEGVWILDSLYVAELKENTEIPVDYNDIMNLDRVIFTKLNLRTRKHCTFTRKQVENTYGLYGIMEDERLILDCESENTLFGYHYQLSEDLTLAGKFPGGAPDGLLAQYRVFMRFKKQSNH